MAIARIPTKAVLNAVQTTVDEKKIEALIDKGGSSTLVNVPATPADDDAIKTVLVRTYKSQVQEIDQILAQLPKRQRSSRNTYIVEAIDERIKRDKAKRR